MIGYRRNKAIDALSEETKALCDKRGSPRKKVVNSKKSDAAAIQEYRKVDCIVKKKLKKLKDYNWIRKYKNLKRILERMIRTICSNRYVK